MSKMLWLTISRASPFSQKKDHLGMSDMAMPILHPESRLHHVHWLLSCSVMTCFYLMFPGGGYPPIFEGLGQVDSLLQCSHKVSPGGSRGETPELIQEATHNRYHHPCLRLLLPKDLHKPWAQANVSYFLIQQTDPSVLMSASGIQISQV